MKKLIQILFLVGIFFMSSLEISNADSIRTPDGNMPYVHWAVVESKENKMDKILSLGAKILPPVVSKEKGTYALYGGLDVSNNNIMRLLEIYESLEAYRIHTSSEAFQQYRAERFPILKSLKILEVNGIALEQKTKGTGTIVFMTRYEIEHEKLAEYQELAKAEAKRAVKQEKGVMGMFVTAEADNLNIIHTMEIYKDKAEYDKYIASKDYQQFQEKIKNMILSKHTIENLPTKIVLTDKGTK